MEKKYGAQARSKKCAMEKLVYADNFADKDGNIVSADTYGMPADFPKDLIVTVVLRMMDRGPK